METKIPYYDVLNKLLIGLAFIGATLVLYFSHFIESYNLVGAHFNSIILLFILALSYYIGLIINRIGSLFESIFKTIHLLPFDNNYTKYNDAEKKYPKMLILSREYAVSRTSFVLFLILGIMTLLEKGFFLSLILFAIAFLFYFSWRKFAKKIIALMNKD